MKTICFLIIFAFASPILIFGQESKLAQKPVEPQVNSQVKQYQNDLKRSKAVNLVEQTASEAVLWDDRDAAVLALTDAADLLWDENPQTRAWLAKAWDLIEKVEERQNVDELRSVWRGSQRSHLRTRVLSVAQKRDPQLAERFFKKLEESHEGNDGKRGAFDDRSARSEQLLRLALDAIETNPALAQSLAERSLQDGISFNLQTVLLRLRQRDLNLATRLFDSALARLMNSSATFSENQILASYLFKPGQIVARLPNGATTLAVMQMQLPEQTPAQADPARARQFLTAVYRTLLSTPPPSEEQIEAAAEFTLLANSLAQPFQIYAPDLWQSIALRAAQFAAILPIPTAKPISGFSDKVHDAVKKGASAEEVGRLRVEALEQEAEKESNPVARKLKFAEAALATAPHDFERGKLLADKIAGDDKLCQEVTAFLFYRAALTFLAEGNLKKAEDTALRIPSSVERALSLVAVAQKLTARKPQPDEEKWQADASRQRALELLLEADKSLKPEDASLNIAKVRLGKVAISNLFDVSKALTDFDQAIAVINRLDKFDPTDASAPRLGVEGFGSAQSTVARVNFGFGFRSALEPLINDDFEHVITAIGGLASPSVRGNCRLEAAKQLLQSLPIQRVTAQAQVK